VSERVFGRDGLLAQRFSGYEPRPSQQQMADLVERMLNDQQDERVALIEAGTGTGKSYAYLVPAIESGQKVLVSTETISLQEQLIRKDLPALEAILGHPIKFAIAKGRGNYFCERNTISFVQDQKAKLEPSEQLITAEQLLGDFTGRTWDGNKATVKRPVPDFVWADFSGDDSCTGAKCEHSGTCAYMAARQKVADADIIVANHHYAALDSYVFERVGIRLLPEHRFYIADEAHTLPDIVQSVYGLEIRQGQPRRFVQKLLRQLKALKLDIDWKPDMVRIEDAADAFFSCFRGAPKEEQLWEEFPEDVLAQAERRMEELVTVLKPIQVAIHRAAATCNPSEEMLRALRMLKSGIDGMIGGLREMFEEPTIRCDCWGQWDPHPECDRCNATGRIPNPDPPVRYAEVTKSRERDGKRHVTLHSKPAETAPIFRRMFRDLSSVILTSATLSVGGSFSAVCEEFGLGQFDVETLRAASPFNYREQVRGYYPRTIPVKSAENTSDYHDALTDEILRIVDWTGGRTFVLFTSNFDLSEVKKRLYPVCPYPLLCQGDMSKDLLVSEFRSEPSVLLGNKSFWTGVDISGAALSCVVLVAFPFPQPDAPLVKARCQRIDAKHGKMASFQRYSLPRVVRDVQQGFGRLIRSNSDRGLFVVLDPRWHTKAYAKRTIAPSLPLFPGDEELPTDWSLDDAIGLQPEAGAQVDEAHGASLAGTGLLAASAAQCSVPLPGAVIRLPSVAYSVAPSDQPGPGAVQPVAPGSAANAGDGAAGRPGGDVGAAGAGDNGSGVVGGAHGAAPVAGTGGSDPAIAPHPLRWRYLRAWLTNQYLDRGAGDPRSLCAGLTAGERNEARAMWNALYAQYLRVDERNRYLCENPEHPRYWELHEKTRASEQRWSEMQAALIEWAAADSYEFLDLWGEIINGLERSEQG
jgi:ATP-dependent DNA helicase DinG